jgi:transposase
MDSNLIDFGRKLTAKRGPNGELQDFERAAILTAVVLGQSNRATAEAFGVSEFAVRKTIQRWVGQQSLDSKARKGRPKVLDRRGRRTLLRTVKKNRRISNRELRKTLGFKISYSTIKRTLREANQRKWKAQKRIPLTKEVAEDRLAFANWGLANRDDLLRVSGIVVSNP